MSSQISGSLGVIISLNDATGNPVYTKAIQQQGSPKTPVMFSVTGNELLTGNGVPIPPGGVNIGLPSNSSAATITAVQLSKNIATYTCANSFSAGQNVTVTGCTSNSIYNVTNQTILAATSTSFTISVTNADLPLTTENAATATATNGISLLYLRNTGNGNVTVTWTPSGGISEAIVPLPSGAEMNLVLPAGSGGITALSLASSIVGAAIAEPTGFTNNVATFTTPQPHGFSVGQLVTTTGLASPFNLTAQPIVSVPTSTTFTVAVSGPQFTLTQAAFSAGSVTYTGTITGGASNALVGNTYTFAGFVNAGNNGTFVVTASTATTLVVTNANGVNETHAGTATLISIANPVLTLTQATFSAGSVTYTGTINGGASNGFVGQSFVIAGFTNPDNNGTFVVTASTATTLVVTNAGGVNETHSATATQSGDAAVSTPGASCEYAILA